MTQVTAKPLLSLIVTESDQPYVSDAKYIATELGTNPTTIGWGRTPREAILDVLDQMEL